MDGDEHQDIEGVGELPDVRRDAPRPPSAGVLIVFAMIGMFVIANASAVWGTFAQVAPLTAVAYALVLMRWAGRP